MEVTLLGKDAVHFNGKLAPDYSNSHSHTPSSPLIKYSDKFACLIMTKMEEHLSDVLMCLFYLNANVILFGKNIFTAGYLTLILLATQIIYAYITT